MGPKPIIAGHPPPPSIAEAGSQHVAGVNSPGIRHIFSSRADAAAAIAQLPEALCGTQVLAVEDGALVLRSRDATDDALFDGSHPWGVTQRLDGGARMGALRKALQAGGLLRLVAVSGTDSIAASLPPPLAALRPGRGTRLSFVAAGTNSRPDPTITLAGVTRTIRDVDGTRLRPGDLKAGRSYDLRIESATEARVVTPGISLKVASGLEETGDVGVPTTGCGSQRHGPALFTPDLWMLEMSRGLPGCPPPLALYPQQWSAGTAWPGQVRVAQPDAHTPLRTPWQEDGDVIHPCAVEFYHGFRGFRYLLGITGYPERREKLENPILYGSNDLRSWLLLPGMPQPLGTTPVLPQGQNGHTSDIWLAHDPRTGNLIVGWRVTVRLDGSGSAPGRIRNSLWFRESRDGFHWSPAAQMLEAPADEDALLSPSLLFDPATCTWHLYSVHKPLVSHRTAPSLLGPWSAPEMRATPPGCRPHHLEVRWVGDRLAFLIHSMAEANLFFGTLDNWREWSFNEAPVLIDQTRGCYKASFLPEMQDGKLSFTLLWTTGAGSKQAAPGPTYQLLIARSNAVPVAGATGAGEALGRSGGTRAR